jgi:hypothetical protein
VVFSGAKPQSRVQSGGLVKVKVQKSRTGLERPLGFQEDEASRYHDNRHTTLVRLSASRTGRLYSPGNISRTHFVLQAESTPVHIAAGKVIPMKSSNYTTGNRTCVLPVCGAVHQYFNVGTK